MTDPAAYKSKSLSFKARYVMLNIQNNNSQFRTWLARKKQNGLLHELHHLFGYKN